MLIDTHCHLDFPEFDPDRDQVLARAAEAGVKYVINIASSLRGSENSVALAGRYPNVFAVVGCHPHEAKDLDAQTIPAIRALAGSPKVVAIGEIGLDYYRSLSPEEQQKKAFIEFLRLAKDLGLPVVIHSRQAHEDTLRIMGEEKIERAVIHCFSGGADFLKACLDRGYFVSFTCNATYKKAQDVRDAIKLVPLDRICLETDAPYLSPEGHRGKRNEPSFVKLLAEEVARIKGVTLEEIAQATTRNAVTFFNLRTVSF